MPHTLSVVANRQWFHRGRVRIDIRQDEPEGLQFRSLGQRPRNQSYHSNNQPVGLVRFPKHPVQMVEALQASNCIMVFFPGALPRALGFQTFGLNCPT